MPASRQNPNGLSAKGCFFFLLPAGAPKMKLLDPLPKLSSACMSKLSPLTVQKCWGEPRAGGGRTGERTAAFESLPHRGRLCTECRGAGAKLAPA